MTTAIEPRARNTDPATSHMASKRAERFAASHAGQILMALRTEAASYGLTADEIGVLIGLTVVQVDRRTIELQRKGLIRVRQVGGQDEIRWGMRVWEAV